MQKKQLAFDQLYDIRAVRIVTEKVQDCYAVLGIVHTSWQHLPKEFDDYIATPKQNGYQSIHTVVLGPQGRPIEIQIRTRQMHDDAELGVAAHWRYKEGGPGRHAKARWMKKSAGCVKFWPGRKKWSMGQIWPKSYEIRSLKTGSMSLPLKAISSIYRWLHTTRLCLLCAFERGPSLYRCENFRPYRAFYLSAENRRSD